MSFPKLLGLITLFLFGTIGLLSLFKGKGHDVQTLSTEPIEISLVEEQPIGGSTHVAVPVDIHANTIIAKSSEGLPEADRVDEFFSVRGKKFPIVKTVTYKSRVDWLKGRPAWLSDYASHYATSRHFIARSLNGKPDYFKQNVAEGNRFNVLDPDKDISFYLLIDISRSRMWFYYLDNDTNERVLVKSYPISLGRLEDTRESGSLTPIGKYSIGDRIAIYHPDKKGFYNGEKVEMIQVFGSRWIPFEDEISGCSEPAKGLGIHGLPWLRNEKGEIIQDRASLGTYSSDGCIRLATEDVEELFAIIITRPAVVELVRDYYDADPPGIEYAS